MIYYVSGFMYSPDLQNVVLIEKRQPKWQKGLLNGVGGKIEANETPEMAMAREFAEETGLSTDPIDWKVFSTITGENNYKVYFLATTNENFRNVKTVEVEEVGIYKTENLPHNVIHNLKWLIPMSLDTKLSFSKPVDVEEV